MDLITGIAIVTAAFMISVGIIAHAVTGTPRLGGSADPGPREPVLEGHLRALFSTLVIGFFVSLTDVLVSAGLLPIAAVNLVIGAGAVGILFAGDRRHGSDGGDW